MILILEGSNSIVVDYNGDVIKTFATEHLHTIKEYLIEEEERTENTSINIQAN